MINLRVEDFVLLDFFAYSSKIPNSCKLFTVKQNDKADMQSYRRMEKFINDLIRRADEISGEGQVRFTDNNVVWKLKHKVTGKEIYVGDSDWEYSIGLRVKVDQGRVYNFATKSWADDITNMVD